MNWQLNENDTSSKMIKYHQIESLIKFSKYKNVLSFFVFNFRDEDSGNQRTYFQNVEDFNRMINKIRRKSFDEIHLIQYGAIVVKGEKKRTRYFWNIKELLDKLK